MKVVKQSLQWAPSVGCLPCLRYPHRLPSADFTWFSRHRDLSWGFPRHPKTGHSFPAVSALGHFWSSSCLSFIQRVEGKTLSSYCLNLSLLVLPCAPLPVSRFFILYLYLYQHIKTNYNSRWTTAASHQLP